MASGGIFRFKCAECGQFEKFTWASDIDKVVCPVCSNPAPRLREDSRAYGADFSTPYLSRGMGVMPEQIEEARKLHPHHEFAPDGRMIIRSVRDYDRIRKDLGME